MRKSIFFCLATLFAVLSFSPPAHAGYAFYDDV